MTDNGLSGLKNKEVLVTGGCGFIGSEIVKQLSLIGANVTIIDNLSSGKEKYIEGLSVKNKLKTVAITAMKKDKSSRELYRHLGFVEGEESGNRIYMEKEIF